MSRRLLLNWRILAALLLCATLALAPAIAEARAGSSSGGRSSSMGSRGSRSFENNGAQPLSRSTTPRPEAPRQPGLAPPDVLPRLRRRQLLSAASVSDGARRRVYRIVVVRAYRLRRRRRRRGGGIDARHAASAVDYRAADLFRGAAVPRTLASRMAGGRRRRRLAAAFGRRGGGAGAASTAAATSTFATPISRAFRRSMRRCRRPGARAISGALRRLMTPEMLGYFSEELTRNASQGVRNVVADVELLKGDLGESWEEGDVQYATAYLRWRATDYVVRAGRAAGRPRLPGQRRPAPAGRGRGGVDLCPPPRRRLAALRHPAGVTTRERTRRSALPLHGHATSGGSDINIASGLPPVFSPNTVPRS